MSQAIKQAILLAAGLGTRLKPMTQHTPKCLVPINGKPLLYIWLEQLAQAGIEKFVINTHYLSEQVEKAITTHPLNKQVELVFEPELLGTAGSVRNIMNTGLCDNTDTLIVHADNLCLCDWHAFFDFYISLPEECIGVMMSFITDSPKTCGILEVDEQGWLRGFHEKVTNPPSNLANAAIYIFSPEGLRYFQHLAAHEKDISVDIVPKLMGKMKVWANRKYLRDIGSPQAYELAQKEVLLLP